MRLSIENVTLFSVDNQIVVTEDEESFKYVVFEPLARNSKLLSLIVSV